MATQPQGGLPQSTYRSTPLRVQPGIVRDVRDSESIHWVDGRWVRFSVAGHPKKMGGWKPITTALPGLPRALYLHSRATDSIAYSFSSEGVHGITITNDGTAPTSVVFSRTPAAGFTADAQYLWQVAGLFDSTGGGSVRMLAHASKTALNIADETNYPVWNGDVTATGSLLTDLGHAGVSGGIVVLQPFLFVFGNNGLIQNSVANVPATFSGGDSNTANVAASKIVRGLPIRGGSAAPAGLFWSLESLIRVSYVGGTAKWRYETLSTDVSVMSAASCIEYNGVFYWLGLDRWFQFNGAVRELPNEFNANDFFDNLNWEHRSKIWAHVEARYGEVWWCYPRGTATECTHAVVFNAKGNFWFDTPLARGAGLRRARAFRYPLMGGNVASGGTYSLHVHEFGRDEISGDSALAIDSYVTSPNQAISAGALAGPIEPGLWTHLARVEPLVTGQIGDLELTVLSKEFPNEVVTEGETRTLTPGAAKVDTRTQGRYLFFRVRSHDVNGDFTLSNLFFTMDAGDRRS